MNELSYRRARAALACGVAAASLHGFWVWSMLSYPEVMVASLAWGPWLDLMIKALGIVGVSFAAIASYRKEWGPSLVVGWLISVAPILINYQPFVFAEF